MRLCDITIWQKTGRPDTTRWRRLANRRAKRDERKCRGWLWSKSRPPLGYLGPATSVYEDPGVVSKQTAAISTAPTPAAVPSKNGKGSTFRNPTPHPPTYCARGNTNPDNHNSGRGKRWKTPDRRNSGRERRIPKADSLGGMRPEEDNESWEG